MNDLKAPPEGGRIIIVGAGIVGSALAFFLSSSKRNKKQIVLVDRSLHPLKGSTGHAPGFVGQFNESEVLTSLARESVTEYLTVDGGFDVVGGMEVASTENGVEMLNRRAGMAQRLGLEATILENDEALSLAPDLLRKGDVKAALHFPRDGAADAETITKHYRARSKANGVIFVEADVEGLKRSQGQVSGIQTSLGILEAPTVIIATGIWTASLLQDQASPIPIVPVAHPYTYGEDRPRREHKEPWVRWPEHHVYARDHGTRDGLGSYDHPPMAEVPAGTAIGHWKVEFESTLKRGWSLLPRGNEADLAIKFNGIFAMTPDNLPLAGAMDGVDGLFVAAAIWVTQAAGVAKFIAKQVLGEEVDARTRKALDPNRFRGGDLAKLRADSLAGYNNIYKTQPDEN